MRVRREIFILLACCVCAHIGLAEEWAPIWRIKGDPSLESLASKSQLDACMAKANQHMNELPHRRLSISVYTNSAGQPVRVAILQSSGFPELDRATAECIHEGIFKREAKKSKPDYLVFTIEWNARQLPRFCEARMILDAVVTVKVSPPWTPDDDSFPSTADAVICECLNEGEKEPADPVVLSSSGDSRLDEGAVSLISKGRYANSSTAVGCKAYKFHFVK